MGTAKLLWFFVWRMVAWMLTFGLVVGVLIAFALETALYAGGGAREVIGALGRGAFIGCFFGATLGIACGLTLSAMTPVDRRLSARVVTYKSVAAALCAGVVLVPAGLLAVQPTDYPRGMFIFMPTPFELLGIPLLISAPFCTLAAYRVAKSYPQRASGG